MKEQTINWNISNQLHSELHATKIEHTHNTNGIELTVIFTESLAAGLLELTKEHDYVMHQIYVPALDSDGNLKINDRIYSDGSVSSDRARYEDTAYMIKEKAIALAEMSRSTTININSILAGLAARVALIPEAERLVAEAEKRRKTTYAEYKEKQKAAEIARVAVEKERNAKADEKKQLAINEKVGWVNQHGSELLQRGIAGGYSCTKRFILEKGNFMLGSEYEMDYDKIVTTKTRSCPTVDALDEVDRLKDQREDEVSVKVVWLPEQLNELDNKEERREWGGSGCEGIEVIVENNYFYKIV